MRTFARTVARNQSIKKIGNTNMFKTYFEKIWRSNFEKIWRSNGENPENLNGQSATKKGRRPRFE